MSLKKQYGRSFRNQLGHFPVWEPCSPTNVGDYGEIAENCFYRLGSLMEDYGVSIKTKTSEAHSWEFQSLGVKVERLAADGSVGQQLQSVRGRLKLSFDAAYSIFIRAGNTKIEQLENAAGVFEAIQRLRTTKPAKREWKGRYVIVSGLRTASPLTLFMNTTKGSAIELSGSGSVLDGLEAGSLSGSAGLAAVGDAGLKVIGANGAIYVDLAKVGLFGAGPAMLKRNEGLLDVDPKALIED